MKMRILVPILLLLAMGLTSCNKHQSSAQPDPAVAGSVLTGIAANHIDLDEQEMYTACSECHREETPDLYNVWYNSTHGIAQVKCYQCHGTFEDMELVPDVERCEVCHTDRVDNCGNDMACWQCHPAHQFTGHK